MNTLVQIVELQVQIDAINVALNSGLCSTSQQKEFEMIKSSYEAKKQSLEEQRKSSKLKQP